MYVPEHFREDQRSVLEEFMRAQPFATLVSAGAHGLQASHVPLLFDPEKQILRGHVARANPHWRTLPADGVAIFLGPHAYVSPQWYPSKRETGKVVPTWNYAAVHAYGALRVVEDRAWLLRLVSDLSTGQEAAFAAPWAVSDAPAEYTDKMLNAIVGIELVVARLEGKWKLSQNRTEADRDGVVKGLGARGDAASAAVAALMTAHEYIANPGVTEMTMNRTLCRFAVAGAALWGAASANAAPAAPFQIEETSIAQVHAAMKAGQLTCHALVAAYLARIDAYDKKGPAINAIVVVNPEALAQADELDRRFKQNGLTGPLHCVPAIVKDNFETIGLQSAGGSLSLKGFVSDKDAFEIKRIKDAGAIVLAKSNMAEFAFSPIETVNSILPGYTRNPYALDRVTAGSSGGTAASIAANFGLIGFGTDTGDSIRGPSAHLALAGIRSTMGLTSRAGVIPLNLRADIAGPMTRTLTDAVTVFQVIAGEDPNDPATAAVHGRKLPNYLAALVPGGLKGARIGVLHQAYERDNEPVDPDVARVFSAALDALRAGGAVVVDDAKVDLAQIQRDAAARTCMGFKYDINAWLAGKGDRVRVHSLADIIASKQFHPSIQARLQAAQDANPEGPDSDACKAETAYRKAFGAAVTKAMDDLKLDAFVYPTWSYPPRLIGDLNTPGGDNSQVFSPTSGFPAINVPMGYTRENRLPAGVTFFGRAFDEPRLIKLAYGYEQATHHRRPPASAPPLDAAPAQQK